jgi:hypothetical protein
MEKEVRELDGEGVAIHVGPESCVRVREGAGEAVTGVRAGWVIEPRKLNKVRGAVAAEVVEERGPAKGKRGQRNAPRTQSRSERVQ